MNISHIGSHAKLHAPHYSRCRSGAAATLWGNTHTSLKQPAGLDIVQGSCYERVPGGQQYALTCLYMCSGACHCEDHISHLYIRAPNTLTHWAQTHLPGYENRYACGTCLYFDWAGWVRAHMQANASMGVGVCVCGWEGGGGVLRERHFYVYGLFACSYEVML